MNENIIKQMTEVVESVMKGNKSDFYKYDANLIKEWAEFPYVWIVGDYSTHLISIGSYEALFNNYEYERYRYMQGVMPLGVYYTGGHLNPYRDHHFYLITENEVREIQQSQLKEIERDIVIPVVTKWKSEHGPLPKYTPASVKLHNITLSELKALVQECRDHGDDSLMKTLKSKRWARRSADHTIHIYWDRTYHEFSFVEKCGGNTGICGGIIFHGWPESGYKTNYSVQLTPTYGWCSHT